ncbi:MAG: FIST C-terminal domain-containing protein [Deltaproteobacteria bacterium]|nr:FIST C-terminal domain-containing protein [Deltaproteobacteria bacterium]
MSSVEMVHARTSARDAEAAAEELCKQLGSVKPKLVVMFASRDRDHVALNKALRDRLPKETRLLGSSTNGEIDRNGMYEDSVVVAALYGDFDVGLGLGRELSLDAARAGENAIRSAARQLDARPDDLASKKYVALVIDDAFRFKKEELLLGVMAMNQALVAVGGGAADNQLDVGKASALVHIDGDVATDAVALALFRTDAPWAALRSHWYLPTGQTLRITKIDESARRALEIDGKPAAARYAELLGVGVDDLEFGKPNGFASRPTALRVGREYFIRAPWKPLDDGSIVFANMLEEGSELELVKMTDMVESTKKFFEHELPARVQSPRAALLFHCSGRKIYAQLGGKYEELATAFKYAPPCIGFNVQFEIYCGFTINSTLTALAFGASA